MMKKYKVWCKMLPTIKMHITETDDVVNILLWETVMKYG